MSMLTDLGGRTNKVNDPENSTGVLEVMKKRMARAVRARLTMLVRIRMRVVIVLEALSETSLDSAAIDDKVDDIEEDA